MLKRKQKAKLNPTPSNNSHSSSSRCEYCCNHNQTDSSIIDKIVMRSLRQKYTEAQINACGVFNIQMFISGASKIFPGGYSQFDRIYGPQNDRELFRKFYPITKIKEKVTRLIKTNTAYGKYDLMHFQRPYCNMLMRHQSSQRILNKILLQKHQIFGQTAAEQGRYTKKTKRKPKEKEKEKDREKGGKDIVILSQTSVKNQSLEELKALTKSIDRMCLKFKSKKPLIVVDFKKNTNKKLKTQQTEFIKSIQAAKCSFIKADPEKKSKSKSGAKKKTSQHVTTVKKGAKDSEQIYGLDQNYAAKKKSTPTPRTFSGVIVCEKTTEQTGRTMLDSPASRAYYYLKQMGQTQKGEIRNLRKRSNSFKTHRSINNQSKSGNKISDTKSSNSENKKGNKFQKTRSRRHKLVKVE